MAAPYPAERWSDLTAKGNRVIAMRNIKGIRRLINVKMDGLMDGHSIGEVPW